MADVIDRHSSVPYYLQLAQALERDIRQRVRQPGDALPPESELCRLYGLARSTVRQTLRMLEARGCVRVVPRRGAFVVHPNERGWVLQAAEGFFEGEVGHDRRVVQTEVIGAGPALLPQAAAQALNLAEGSSGFVLRRVRRLDGKVALYSVNYLPPELGELILDSEVMSAEGSLNRVLRRGGYVPCGAKRAVEAVAAPDAIARHLGVAAGAPLLLVSSVSWDKHRRPFDYHSTWTRTDVVKVTVEAAAASSSIALAGGAI